MDMLVHPRAFAMAGNDEVMAGIVGCERKHGTDELEFR